MTNLYQDLLKVKLKKEGDKMSELIISKKDYQMNNDKVEEYKEISSENEEIYNAIKKYIENSKLVKRKIKTKKAELYFLKGGKIFFIDKTKTVLVKDNVGSKTSKNLEKITRNKK